MVNDIMRLITDYDPEVGKAIEQEAARQRRNLELIASENIVSEPVMMAMGTVLTNNTKNQFPAQIHVPASAFRLRHSDGVHP